MLFVPTVNSTPPTPSTAFLCTAKPSCPERSYLCPMTQYIKGLVIGFRSP